MLYRIVRAMAHLAVHVFFRRIDIEGAQNVPDTGPILIVSNHSNALVDPLLIVTSLRRRVTATAKHTLAKNGLLRAIMAACGVVTFHRQQDAGADSSRRDNLQSLQQCEDILADGGAICIFPEGVSHSDSKLRVFRNGAARIACQYVRDRGNPGGLLMVPTGLLYTAKDRFRSDVWIRFGEPLDVERWLAENPTVAPVDLTHAIEQRVESLTINTPTRREQYLLTWAAEIVATRAERPTSIGRENEDTADYFRLVARLEAGWEQLIRVCPETLQRLARRIRAYRKQLRRVGIVPKEVFLQLNYGRAAFFLFRELELMVIGGPMALFGAINHAAPYLLVKQIAKRLSSDKDHWASNAIYPSFVIFPFFYFVQLAAVWLLLPRFWAIIYTIALPYTGYYAVLYGDRFQRAWRRARTFLRFALHPTEQQQLATEGREIIEEIRALGSLVEYQQETTGVPS